MDCLLHQMSTKSRWKKALNLLKPILSQHAFFGRGPQIGPKVFITDDSSAERNALELCWPEGKDFILNSTFISFSLIINNFLNLFNKIYKGFVSYVRFILQAFWRWLYNANHHIKKEDRVPIMMKMKEILYAPSGSEMHAYYNEFKQKFYDHYPQLYKHFELL